MREMKNSGIAWIPFIPQNWTIKKLKYFVNSLTKGNGITKEDVLYNGDTPCVRYGEIYSKYDYTFTTCISRTNKDRVSSQQYFTYGDILFACTGELIEEIGRNIVYLGNEQCLAGGDIIIAKHDLNPSFLNYALNSSYVQSQKGFGKAKLKVVHISALNLGNLMIALPTLDEQQRIADYLDIKCQELNSLIIDIQQQIETLEEYKRSVITEAVTKGLAPDVEMRDSKIEFIGKVPKHWEIRRMKTLGTVRNGLTYTPQDICDENEGTLVLRSSNVQNGKISLKDNVYVSCEIKSDLMVKYGDILICSRNGSRELIGKNAIIKNLNATFGAFMMIFRSESPEYLYYVLNSHVFSYYLGTFFTSTINQLTGFNFGNMKVAFCPNVREQRQIADCLDKKCAEIDSIIVEKKLQIETIEEYKKSLIFEYVTGKKEVEVNV